MATIIQYSRQ